MGQRALAGNIIGVFALFAAPLLRAPPACGPVSVYSPCEVVFELAQPDAAAHPNPYKTVTLQAEFRSPRHRTFLMPAFWDGGSRLVIRFSPTEPGDWDFRVTSNIESWNGKTGQFAATASE